MLFILFLIGIVILLAVGANRIFRPAVDAKRGDSSFHLKSKNEINVDRFKIKYEYQPPYRTRNGVVKRSLTVHLERTSPVALFLYRQTRLDDWLLKLGFSHEMILGIPWLDRQFHIATSDEPATQRFLMREEVQTILRDLLSPFLVSISIEPRKYSVMLEGFDPLLYENLPALVTGIGHDIATLVPQVSEDFQHSSMSSAWRLAKIHSAFFENRYLLLLVMGLVGLFVLNVLLNKFYLPLNVLNFYSKFFLLSTLGLGATLLSFRPLIRRWGLSGRVLQRVAVVTILLVWLSWLAGFASVNAKWDRSPVQKVSERILLKWVSHSKSTYHYMIKMESPDPEENSIGPATFNMELPQTEWQPLNPGADFIHLELREGYFHAPWIQAHWFEAHQ